MSAERVAAILAASRRHLDALQTVALAGPPNAWIGAGFVRNAVWDALSGREPNLAELVDLDVVHHGGGMAAADAKFEAALRACRPLPWSVRDQVRMAERNGHPPYRDMAEAVSHWPERATAVAARLARGRIEILAPLGLEDLMHMVLRPTSARALEPELLRSRLVAKGWGTRWPGLRVCDSASD